MNPVASALPHGQGCATGVMTQHPEQFRLAGVDCKLQKSTNAPSCERELLA